MNVSTFKHILIAATAISLAVTGCRNPSADDAPIPAAATVTEQALAALPVRDEDTGAHYNRDDWGDWTSPGRTCSTRVVILQQQGRDVSLGKGCRVRSGTWTSPYDGLVLTDPNQVQIDHRVPVKEAVRSGARDWTPEQRHRFYNDPNNLIAVSAKSNTSKGDRDPGRWTPRKRDAWCDYATAYITTKTTYRLSIDTRERDGLATMLATCH
ncbi:HNH endonuclease family protein [Kibdelosporangium aridum]|uniref:GmrSD restriction endonucleases C-terminal domain-containing protein n=1 Tax=Kibdelosporangium aridum TaxID=2030 RepID=A0A1W2EY96_KIBAR|nr:HNH endonuclease family protein [Kibdelosporangium aridum]SMD14178.1 Protein of unknown function [Kibdelosporangium aridum]